MILGLDLIATQTFGTGNDSTPVLPGVWKVACPAVSAWDNQPSAVSTWSDQPRNETTTEECNQ